ncbi:MAG: hypothetical protein R3F03_12385 [Opitutaceae bacterium]
MNDIKTRLLILSAIFALLVSPALAQEALPELPAEVQAAFDAANGDLGVLAGIAIRFPQNAAAIAQRYARANPTKAAEVAATIAKAVPAQAVSIVSAVVKETPTVDAAAVIVASVLAATGNTGSVQLAFQRNISGAAIASLPASVKTPSELKTFVTIVTQATGVSESGIRMGAYDGSGVGIVTINRATADASRVGAAVTATSAVVTVANTTEVVEFVDVEVPTDNLVVSPT